MWCFYNVDLELWVILSDLLTLQERRLLSAYVSGNEDGTQTSVVHLALCRAEMPFLGWEYIANNLLLSEKVVLCVLDYFSKLRTISD